MLQTKNSALVVSVTLCNLLPGPSGHNDLWINDSLHSDDNVLCGFQTAIFCSQVQTVWCSNGIKDDE